MDKDCPKPCPKGSVCNKKTRRCNKVPKKKRCPPGTFRNPKTGRCNKKKPSKKKTATKPKRKPKPTVAKPKRKPTATTTVVVKRRKPGELVKAKRGVPLPKPKKRRRKGTKKLPPIPKRTADAKKKAAFDFAMRAWRNYDPDYTSAKDLYFIKKFMRADWVLQRMRKIAPKDFNVSEPWGNSQKSEERLWAAVQDKQTFVRTDSDALRINLNVPMSQEYRKLVEACMQDAFNAMWKIKSVNDDFLAIINKYGFEATKQDLTNLQQAYKEGEGLRNSLRDAEEDLWKEAWNKKRKTASKSMTREEFVRKVREEFGAEIQKIYSPEFTKIRLFVKALKVWMYYYNSDMQYWFNHYTDTAQYLHSVSAEWPKIIRVPQPEVFTRYVAIATDRKNARFITARGVTINTPAGLDGHTKPMDYSNFGTEATSQERAMLKKARVLFTGTRDEYNKVLKDVGIKLTYGNYKKAAKLLQKQDVKNIVMPTAPKRAAKKKPAKRRTKIAMPAKKKFIVNVQTSTKYKRLPYASKYDVGDWATDGRGEDKIVVEVIDDKGNKTNKWVRYSQ